MLAAASDAVVLGFNVRPVGDARAAAEREGVEIRTYSVIYQALDDLRDAMNGMLAPEEVEETVGNVEVRQTFRASRVGTIAGCYVTDGQRHARRARSASCATAPSSTTRRSPRCGASTTTCARSPPATSAASCSPTTRTSRRATCSRSTRRGRSSASSSAYGGRGRRRARTSPCSPIHLHFPDAGELKAKRKELQSVKAQLHGAPRRRRRRGRRPGHVAARDARRRADGRLARARCRQAVDRVEAWLLDAASRRACASSAA